MCPAGRCDDARVASTRPTPRRRLTRTLAAAALAVVGSTAGVAGGVVTSPTASAQAFRYADAPMLWTVAHGPACAGWVTASTVVAENMPGQTRLVVTGNFFGLSWNPPHQCWSTVKVHWHNLDSDRRGYWEARTAGAVGVAPTQIGQVHLDTGPGRVVLSIGTDLHHLPVRHEVTAY